MMHLCLAFYRGEWFCTREAGDVGQRSMFRAVKVEKDEMADRNGRGSRAHVCRRPWFQALAIRSHGTPGRHDVPAQRPVSRWRVIGELLARSVWQPAAVRTRARDAPMEACSACQLGLFAETLTERTRAEVSVANDRLSLSKPNREVLLAEPAKPSTPPGGMRSATDRAPLTKPFAGGQSTLPRLSVSPDEAAAILGVSRDYFDEHVIGELRVVRRGRRILIALAELERWLDRAATRATVGRSS
jgi:excisionase family DNA binding protein